MNDYNCRRLRSGNIRGNIIFIFAAQKSLRAFLSCFFTQKGRKGKRAYPTDVYKRQVKPLAKKVDAEEYFPKETVEKMGKLGMMGIYFPTEVGGARCV